MSKAFNPLTIDNRPPAGLRPDPRNPRSHKPPQVAAIARSIRTFGFNMPVLVDGNDMIIAGHGRVAAALKLGLAEIPVIRIDHLSDDQRRAYMIADNRLTDTSRWDERLLGEVLRELTLADLDFELDAIGFSVGEIDMKIEGLDDRANDADDDIPPSTDPAVTEPGDVWRLGEHRILCGDALDPACWARLMNERQAAMAIADVPFNLPVAGHVSGLGKVQHREFAMGSGEMDRDQFTGFLRTAFHRMAENSLAGSLHYVFIDWRHTGEMTAAGESAFTELKNVCVWDKGSGAMGSLYRSQHELVFVWKHGRARHRNNVELGRHGRNRTNVWRYPGIAGFRHSEDGDLLAAHPTCKPVKLVADAILDVTARGDIVVDPFMGSGTTLIAAERVGRVAYGLEIDPLYCDTIIRRWEALTGEQAVHDQLERSFAEVAKARDGRGEGSMTAVRSGNGRFGPGNCANPKGRPRKDRSVGAAILKELQAPVTITENHQRRRISKLEANAKQIANKGASGELRAAKMVMDLAMKAESGREAAPPQSALGANDREIVARFVARLRLTFEQEGTDANTDAR